MKLRRVLILILCVIFLGLCYLCVSLIHYESCSSEADLDASRQTNEIYNKTFQVTVSDKVESKSYKDLVEVHQVITLPVWYKSYFEEPSVMVTYTAKESVLHDWISGLYLAPIDAQILYTREAGWELVDCSDRYAFDVESEVAKALTALYQGQEVFKIEDLTSANVRAEDLREKYAKVSWLNGFHVKYAGETYLDGHDLTLLLDAEYNLDADSVDLSELKKQLDLRWTTRGNDKTFVTSAGEEIVQPYVTYGTVVDWESEETAIRNAIVHQVPYEVDAPATNGYDDFTDTYIEVSLDAQHVWHYVDGALCCESDCVTGTKDRRDTPTGIYYVSERIPGKYLTGADYKTWVDRWMRLTNSGVGLHDASWRSKFGGSIYTYDGSHGCINLPPNYAYQLFDEIKNGIPTIIY